MLGFLGISRAARRSWRRTAAAALIALQAAFAASPAFEPQGETRVDTHAESQGNRHLFAHDEATCVVCAVRNLAVRAPAEPPTWLTVIRRALPGEAAAPIGPTVEPSADNHSRAPPLVS